MTENFPRLIKYLKPQIQKGHGAPHRINASNSLSRHNIFKLKNKNQRQWENFERRQRKKLHLISSQIRIKIILNFTLETIKKRRVGGRN